MDRNDPRWERRHHEVGTEAIRKALEEALRDIGVTNVQVTSKSPTLDSTFRASDAHGQVEEQTFQYAEIIEAAQDKLSPPTAKKIEAFAARFAKK